MKYILSITLICLLFSCSNFDREFKTIEELSLKLDTVELNFSKIDTSVINANNRVIKLYTRIIDDKYAERLQKEQGFILGSYKKTKKTITRFNRAYSNSINELNLSRTQLSNLELDLSKNAIEEKDKIQKFINDETKAITELFDYSFELVEWYNNTNQQFNEVHPKIKFIVDSLESKP